MNYLLRQKISNHKVLTDVERYVELDSFQPVAGAEVFNMCGKIVHEKGGKAIAEMDKIFRLEAGNDKKMFDRDLKSGFAVVKDKDGNPAQIGGFELVTKMFNADVPVRAALAYFIKNADEAGEL